MKGCGLFRPHDWPKWEPMRVEGFIQRHPFAKEMIPFTKDWQVRTCKKCGLHQRRDAFLAGYVAGQRAQAEKDAEIADQYAEAMSGSIETHLAYQASVTIAAAIRAAAPKEGE